MNRQTRILIAGLYLVGLSVGTDFVGVGILLIPIQTDFDITVATSQWVVNAYALSFAMGIVTAGRLADMYGRKRILLIGLVAFAAASLLNALALDVGWLIVTRVLQGAGIAMIWPATIGMLFAITPDEKAGTYIGTLMGMVGVGNVIGPLLAASFAGLGTWGWRLFFVFNVLTAGLAFVAIVIGSRDAPAEELEREKIDYPGIAALSLALFGLLFAFDRATSVGWDDAIVIGCLVGAVILFVVFFVIERRAAGALIPPELWKKKPFVAAILLNALLIPAAFVMFVYIPQLVILVWGYSITLAGIALLPLMIFFAGLSPLAGRIYDVTGPRRLLASGYAAVLAGSILAAVSSPSWGYWVALVPAMVLVGIGVGSSVGPAGTVAVASVDEKDASLAGGLAFQFHLIFGAIGLAVATFIITTSVHTSVSDTLATEGIDLSQSEVVALEGSFSNAASSPADLDKVSPETTKTVTDAADSGFESGFRLTFVFTSVLAAAGIGLVPLLPRKEDVVGTAT